MSLRNLFGIFSNPAPVDLMKNIHDYVVNNKVKEAKSLFEQHPDLSQKEVTLFDPSGCRLENTHYFKHALWTLNEAMAKAVIDGAAKGDNAKDLLEGLSQQFESWRENGIEYKRKDENYHEAHQEQHVSEAFHFDGPDDVREKMWENSMERLEKILLLDDYIENKLSELKNKNKM